MPFRIRAKQLFNEQFTAAEELTKEEVEIVFLEFLRGATTWRESRTWKELEPAKGCFTVLGTANQ